MNTTDKLNGEKETQKALEVEQLASARLHAVIDAGYELMTAPDLDTLYRQVIELAHTKLGVERCGLFILDDSGEYLVGMFGTDDKGKTIDQRSQANRMPTSGEIEHNLLFTPRQAGQRLWTIMHKERTVWEEGEVRELEPGWNCATVMHGQKGPHGIFYNDAAISNAPYDENLQETIALYCSTLASIIERKQAETTIRESEERFRRFTEATIEGLVFHQDGTIVDVNPAAITLFGFSSAEELIGRSLLEFIQADWHELVLEKMQSKTVLAYEIRCIRKDGSTLPIETSTRAYQLGEREIRASTLHDISERKRAEEMLQRTMEQQARQSHRLRAIIEASEELHKAPDLDTTYRRAVELAREKLGIERCGLFLLDSTKQYVLGTYGTDAEGHTTDERMTKNPVEAHNPLQLAPDKIWSVAEGPRNYWIEGKQIEAGSGWVVGTVLRSASGEPIGVIYNDALLSGAALDEDLQNGFALYCSMLANIVERKITNEALSESQNRFRGFTEATREGLVFHEKGTIIDANPAVLAMYGLSRPDELIGRNLLEFVVPEAHELVMQHMLSDSVAPYEILCIRKDGSIFPIETSTHMYEIGGRTLRATSVIDITERKATEDAILKSEEKFRTIADFTYGWETWLSPEGEYLYVSPACERISEYTADEFINNPSLFAEITHPDDRAMIDEHLHDHHSTADSKPIEYRIITKSGGVRWVSHACRAVYDSNGIWKGRRGSNMEITERKNLEHQIQTAFERRGRQVQLSTQVSQSIATATNLDDLYERVVTEVKEQFGYYHAQLLRYDPAQNAVVLVTGYGGIGAKMLATGHRMPLGEGLIGTAAATGETVLRATLENDADWQPNPLLPHTKGEMAVPIKLGSQVLGVLDVQSSVAGAIGTDEQLALEGLCGQIASAIESTRLRQEMDERLEEINRLYRAVSHEGWQSYRKSMEMTTSFMFDHQGGLRPTSETGLADELFARIPMTVPGGEVIGNLSVADDPQRPISPDEEDFIQQVSDQVALALDSARLFEQTEQQRADANKLYEIGQKISAAKDRQEIMAAVAENLDIPQINRAIFLSFEYSGSGEIEAIFINANWYSGHGAPPSELGRRYPAKVFTTVNSFLGHDPSFVSNTQTDNRIDPASRDIFDKQAIRAFISLPLWDDTKQIGSMLLESEEIIPFTGDEFLRYTSIIQQVTSAWENQELLEQTTQGEARLRTLVENAPEAIIVVDLTTGCFAEPNENAVKLYGLSREELVKVGPAQVSPPTQPDGRSSEEEAKEMIDQAMAGENPVFEWIHRNAQGQDIQCEIRLVRLPGERPQVRASVTDITERKLNQEILLQRANQLETVAELSTTASTVLDPDRLLQAVVDLAKERFGLYHAHIYLADESWQTLLLAAGAGEVGRKLVAEQHAIPMNAERSLVARAVRERKAIIVNDVRKEADFLPNPLLPETRAEMAVPMIVGQTLLGVFDVQSTGATGFSKEDADIYTTLAAQVAVALQNARLYVEQAATVTQLRELDRLKSSFLANMSHELRTPLNSILGFADVILEGLDGPLTENMGNDLGLIHKNGQHLLHLINDVLDMAKIEAGRMNLQPENFILQEIIDEVTRLTSTFASEKSLALYIEEGSDQEVEIFADRTRIRQVLINLVNNAIKFTEKGKIAIHALKKDDHVLITVRDTGIGIPPEKLEAVFQEFIQVDISSTRKVGGTGLGLPISRKLVEMHGGRVWAESSGVNGEGTTFYVDLPLVAEITEPEKQEK